MDSLVQSLLYTVVLSVLYSVVKLGACCVVRCSVKCIVELGVVYIVKCGVVFGATAQITILPFPQAFSKPHLIWFLLLHTLKEEEKHIFPISSVIIMGIFISVLKGSEVQNS